MSKRICPIHGIWEKTKTKKRCSKCSSLSSRMYDRNYRNMEADKFYHSREWKKLRDKKLTKDPLCIKCGMPAKIVDHIVEISDGGCRLCMDNLQSMCIACHNSKTAEKKSQRGGAVKSLQNDDEYTEPPTKLQDKLFSGGTLE
jgi:5-methylcytosine-specific restriction endonuclease McrA